MRLLAPMRRAVRAATPALALGTAPLTAPRAACSDAPTAPIATGPARAVNVNGSSYVTSQTTVGDTTVTAFVLGATSSTVVKFNIGNGSQIQFTGEASAVCDPATSSYGPGTWGASCTPLHSPITITAQTWVDKATGKTRSAFKPALRFVPLKVGPVQLYLKDPNYTPKDAIWYCPDGGACVNEAGTDPSLATVYDQGNQWVHRVIKHFSGYTILIG